MPRYEGHTTYRLHVALAATDDGHVPFGLDEPGLDTSRFEHRIIAAFVWPEVLQVAAATIEQALEYAFREANIGDTGWAARYREGRQRSLSVGDMVTVTITDDRQTVTTYWQVLSMGFGQLDPDDALTVLRDQPWSHDAADALLSADARANLHGRSNPS